MKKILLMLLCAASVYVTGCNKATPDPTPTPPLDSVSVIGAKLAKTAFSELTVEGAISVMERQKKTENEISFSGADTVASSSVTRRYRNIANVEVIEINYNINPVNILTSVVYTRNIAGESQLTTKGREIFSDSTGQGNPVQIGPYSCRFREGEIDGEKKYMYEVFTYDLQYLKSTGSHSYICSFRDDGANVEIVPEGKYEEEKSLNSFKTTFTKLK